MKRKNEVRILIVEDDMIIGANISMQLTKLGYDIDGIVTRGEEAILHVNKNVPDLLLLDINLKGKLSGIETAMAIQKNYDIPIIYLTANSDDATFDKARATHPKAFITKPFNKLNLQRTIELVVEGLKEESRNSSKISSLFVMHDRIFVRHNGKMEKVMLKNILYIEADRNYCTIVSNLGNHVLACTLKTMEEKLPETNFLRVHRSYMVNIAKLDVVADHHLEIDRKVIPLSKSHKDFLMMRINTV